MRMRKFGLLLGLPVVLGVLMGCSAAQQSHSETILSQIEHETDHAEPLEIDISQLFEEMTTVEVEAETAVPFHAVARTPDLVKYPCTTCHEAPLNEASLAPDLGPEPHWDVVLEHASSEVMTCTTCHEPENLDRLHSLTNTPIDFDHSYRICAQCHTTQFEEWIGGAHGKRLGGWAPPRVVETCTGCHNPHKPALQSRWPAVTGGGIEEYP